MAPLRQATQLPLPQEPPLQVVPSALAVESSHEQAATLRVSAPLRHGAPGLVEQAAPSRQVMQAAALSQKPPSQAVPNALFVESEQVPSVIEQRPALHSVGLVAHAEPPGH